ncbi:MAG: hypothetical protein J5598_01185 [Clostridia bacterium]|nr:hypothetical protein [Clostridia bacterium]
MFNDVQRLKLREAEEQVARLKEQESAMYDEVRTLKDKLWDLENQERRGLGAYHGKKQFSAFERLVTNRKAYREYQAKLAELKTLPTRIAKLKSEIAIAEMQTSEQIAQSGILQSIEQAQSQGWAVERAQTLAELGMTPVEAIQLLEDNEITPVLDESDNHVFERPREYLTKGKAALCAVHKMDIMPTGNKLETLSEAQVEETAKIVLDGQEYEYKYAYDRNTMHVSMNDEVSSHNWGNWDKCHYTILQPFNEIANERIGSMEPNDTYTRGGIDLTTNAWILCPADEVETVKELNPQVHVLGYKGENSKGLAAPFLSQLGYRAENVGMWGWSDDESAKQFYELAKQEKLNIVQHTNSTDFEDEEFQIGINKAIAIMKMMVEKNLVKSFADFERLRPQLKDVGWNDYVVKLFYSTGVHEPSLISDSAVIANHRQIDVFARKMQLAGMPLTGVQALALEEKAGLMDEENTREGLTSAIYYDPEYGSPAQQKFSPVDFATKIMIDSAVRSRTMETECAL